MICFYCFAASASKSNTFEDDKGLFFIVRNAHLEGIVSALFHSFAILLQKQVIATQLPVRMEARAQKQTLVLNASVHHSGTA